MEFYLIEKPLKGLRACVNCSLLKSYEEFLKEGCDNCEKYLKFKNNPERIILCSSLHFEALVGLSNTNLKWATRLRKIDKFCVGAYAIYVFARIPTDVIDQILTCPE